MTRGSLPLKLRIRGCKPIRRLSGTTDEKVRDRIKVMLRALAEQGRGDLVNAVAAGTIRPLELLNKWKFNRLEELPHADELPLLAEAWPRWVESAEAKHEWSDAHRANIEMYMKRFEKMAGPGATIAALVPVLQEFVATNRKHARSCHLAQSHVQAFYRDTLGRRHRLWLEAADIHMPKVRPVWERHPLTPEKLRELVKALGQPYGMMAWTMATTGMGWREYTGAWEREGGGLRIHGTKTKGRDRLIPLVTPPHRPVGGLMPFRKKLKAQGLTPYDLRRTYTHLMVVAGIPRPFRKAYLGHQADDVTAIYEAPEVVEYLAKHAEAMRTVLGETPTPTLQVVRA